ncbi:MULTISPECIES: Nif11-like leader peptide family natural product precursor [Streptacidiphilus]|uniref:Nif11-like leader peptide family natural product n=2 Tax=Streptacidiphilus TaxID=228398 RepID=A0ABV6UK13_9ACTN|nr:Nif11-like leader peptide family natural product precursor [Streptacidiphilus jeojiense]
MSENNVVEFLGRLGEQPELLERLQPLSKAEVLEAAAVLGLPFTEAQFDSLIWSLEEKLADRRHEPFSERFSLWHVMWGRYYLEYLVLDLLPALQDTALLP